MSKEPEGYVSPYTNQQRGEALKAFAWSRVPYVDQLCGILALREELHDLLLDVGVLNSRVAGEDAIDTKRYEAVLATTEPKPEQEG